LIVLEAVWQLLPVILMNMVRMIKKMLIFSHTNHSMIISPNQLSIRMSMLCTSEVSMNTRSAYKQNKTEKIKDKRATPCQENMEETKEVDKALTTATG